MTVLRGRGGHARRAPGRAAPSGFSLVRSVRFDRALFKGYAPAHEKGDGERLEPGRDAFPIQGISRTFVFEQRE